VKNHVVLSGEDRERLLAVVSTGVHPVRMVARARILLLLDEGAGSAVLAKRVVAERVGVSEMTVVNVARQFSEFGGDVARVVARRKPPVRAPRKITGEVEARLIALACSPPPEGFARWTLRLMERHVKLDPGMPDLDHSAIGKALKKTLSAPT
jgi:transposase